MMLGESVEAIPAQASGELTTPVSNRGEILDTRAALDRFLSRVEKRAFYTAKLATGDPDEALDIVQDAMTRLVQRYADRPDSEWPPLFHRILQSRITDWYRRQAVRNKLKRWFGPRATDSDEPPCDGLDHVPGPENTDPADWLARGVAMEVVEQALHELPLRQRQAFLLRIWEGLDVAETADAMGCSEGSVKTHLFRAKQSLQKLLKEHRE